MKKTCRNRSIKMDDPEWAALQRAADEKGVSRHRYIKEALLGLKAVKKHLEDSA